MTEGTDMLWRCYALTGSIATGKSSVARILAELGAHLIDTDLIAREVVEPGRPALDEIRREFGGRVFLDDGTLDRDTMRHLIIHDEAKKRLLNSITHPRIQEESLKQISAHNKRDDGMPIIIDVPLLYESGWDRFLNRVILVYAPVEVQLERLMERDSLDRETAVKTVNAQMSIEEKKDRATHVIDNSGTLEETRTAVESLFSELCRQIEAVSS